MKAQQKGGMDAVRSGLLKMSEQEETVGADCMAHVFWGVLDDSCRKFSNPLSPEASQARYMYPKIVRLLGTRPGHMAENWHATIYWWMCQSQDSRWEEEQQQQRGISKWDLATNTKVDGNHLRDIRHMCSKIDWSKFIKWLSCKRIRYMDKKGRYSQGHQAKGHIW